MLEALSQLNDLGRAAASRAAQCVWMQAGVVDYKLCDREFDCEHCPFDGAIRDGAHRSSPKPSQGIINFNFDRRPALTFRSRDALSTDVEGYELADALFYHPAHVWARVEEGAGVRAGLDDFGQKLLGRVYSVALPGEGSRVRRGQACWRVTHRAGETSLVSPVSGTVSRVNARLAQHPSLLNRDPYGDGWALVVEPAGLEECLKRLRYGPRARDWYAVEVERLYRKAEELLNTAHAAADMTMPDGGARLKDFTGELTADETRRLVGSFFPAPRTRGRNQATA